MYKNLLMLLFYLLPNAVFSGDVRIRIIKNENGFETEVKPLLRIKDGANFSLNCKVVDTKSKMLLYDNDKLFWGKESGKLKFIDQYSSVMFMENTIKGTNLNFTSVTLKDQGDYFCASPKHNLVKTVSVVVKPRLKKEVQGSVFRQKRFVDNYARETRSIQGWQHPDFSDILEMQNKEIEEKQKREREQREREEAEKKENKKRYLPIKISVAVVAIIIAIALGVYLSIRRLKARRRLLQAFQEAENLMIETRQMNDRVRHLEEQQRVLNRGTAEFHTNGGGSGQVQPSLVRTNSMSTPNLHDGTSKEHDLPPPSYHEAVVGVKPSAPPGDEVSAPSVNDSHLSASRTRKHRDGSL